MITVLVIAESADNCIKTVILILLIFYLFRKRKLFFKTGFLHFITFQMLRNCKVARVLPRIADCAKNDRNAVLRARYNSQHQFICVQLCVCFRFRHFTYFLQFFCHIFYKKECSCWVIFLSCIIGVVIMHC